MRPPDDGQVVNTRQAGQSRIINRIAGPPAVAWALVLRQRVGRLACEVGIEDVPRRGKDLQVFLLGTRERHRNHRVGTDDRDLRQPQRDAFHRARKHAGDSRSALQHRGDEIVLLDGNEDAFHDALAVTVLWVIDGRSTVARFGGR